MSARRSIAMGVLALVAISSALAAILFPAMRQATNIAQPDGEQFHQARQLFSRILGAADISDVRGHAEKLGLTLTSQDQQWNGILISDGGVGCQARGIYLIRAYDDTKGATAPLAITAPHRGSDRHTGTIAANLFLETRAASAAWNSAPRKPMLDCPHAIDLARGERHFFTAFILSFAEANIDGMVLQLHGFDREKRLDRAARDADMILSNGTREPSSLLLDLADCLSIEMAPHRAIVFPNETGELGALGNAQAKALGAKGFTGFVHLEISAGLRAKLAADEGLRARLGSCLTGVLR